MRKDTVTKAIEIVPSSYYDLTEKEMMLIEDDLEMRAIEAELVFEQDDGRLSDHERNYPWFD